MGLFQPLFFCLFVQLLVGVSCFGINFLYDFIPQDIKIPAVVALIVVALVLIFSIASVLPGVKQRKNWTFRMAVLFYLVTCFDFVTAIDLILETQSKGFLLTHYLHCGDPFMENVWVETQVYFDATIPHLIHFIIFYRIFNGQSWRSLYVFNTAAWLAMCPPLIISLLAPEAELYRELRNVSLAFLPLMPPFFIAAIVALMLPKTVVGGNVNKGKGKANSDVSASGTGIFTTGVFKLLNTTLTLTSLLILTTKAIVALELNVDVGGLPLREFYSQNDPMLEFETLPKIVPYGVINMWMYAVTVIPISLIVLLGTLQSVPWGFLWDFSIIQAAVLLVGQAYALGGPLLPSSPEEFRVELENPRFWLVNLLPIVASLANILRLYPHGRISETSLKMKKK